MNQPILYVRPKLQPSGSKLNNQCFGVLNLLSWILVLIDLFSSQRLKSFVIVFADRDDDIWWLLPTILLLFKSIEARFVNWHIANLEIEDFSLFCPDPDAFWAHEPSS